MEIYIVQDTNPGEDIGIVYPDVEVIKSEQSQSRREPVAVFTPATLTLPLPITVRIPTVELRDVENNTLVTCIEILSYVNKRQPGFGIYSQKRDRLIGAGVSSREPLISNSDLLEFPSGPVPLNSSFYIERPPIEERACLCTSQQTWEPAPNQSPQADGKNLPNAPNSGLY